MKKTESPDIDPNPFRNSGCDKVNGAGCIFYKYLERIVTDQLQGLEKRESGAWRVGAKGWGLQGTNYFSS